MTHTEKIQKLKKEGNSREKTRCKRKGFGLRGDLDEARMYTTMNRNV